MSINLQKGQTIDLDKDKYDLSMITIGLGWAIKKKSGKGFLSSMLGGGKEDDYDLDAIAFLLDKNGKVRNLGGQKLKDSDVIFFGNLRHPDGNIYHTGDNLVGGEGSGDDEQIVVRLNSMDQAYDRVLFLVSIYQGVQKKQHFGMVEKAFIRAVDAKGREIAKYNLAEDPSYNNKRSIIFAEVYRKGGGWKFRAIGDAFDTDSFVEILRKYLD